MSRAIFHPGRVEEGLRPQMYELRSAVRDCRYGPTMNTHGSNSIVVEATGLRKSYGSVEALRGVSFEIKKGEVFGLLGPNGAGKTTTIEILEGLRQPDGGTVTVCGMDPGREQSALKERIGAQL